MMSVWKVPGTHYGWTECSFPLYSCADSCAERGCHVYRDAIGWCIHSYSSTVDGGKVSSSLRKKKCIR